MKENLLSPPIIGQYIKLNPVIYKGRPTFRLEFLGCDLNSEFLLFAVMQHASAKTPTVLFFGNTSVVRREFIVSEKP